MKTMIAAFALLAQSAQPAAPAPCIDPVEIEHATLFLLPPVIDGLSEHCRASLPAGAYLLTGGAELSKRLGAERNAHWDAAKPAIVRFGGEEKAGALGADTAAGLLRDIIKSEGGKNASAENCATLDRALALLAPLPPENIAALVALAVETGLRVTQPTPDAVAAATGRLKAGEVRKPKGDKKAAPTMPMPTICPARAPAASGGQ